MKIICSWCKTQIKDDGVKDGKVSHGICNVCEQIENMKLDKQEQKKSYPLTSISLSIANEASMREMAEMQEFEDRISPPIDDTEQGE